MPAPNNSSYRIRAQQRKIKALQLRCQGFGWKAIAEALGYKGESGPKMAVKAALAEGVNEGREHYRALTLERLTAILRIFWPSMQRGDKAAAEVILKVIAQMRALLGLDYDADKLVPVADADHPAYTKEVGEIDVSKISTDDLEKMLAILEATRIVRGGEQD